MTTTFDPGDHNDGVDLLTVSTDTLINAILRRFDHAAFMGVQLDHGHRQRRFYRRWCGDPHMVAGLCADIQRQAMKHSESTETPLDDGA